MSKYNLILRDDGGGQEAIEIEADSLKDAIEQVYDECDSWARGGDWGRDGASVAVRWSIEDEDGETLDDGGCHRIEIEPDHEAMISELAPSRFDEAASDLWCGNDPEDHDWTSEGEGGLNENPGVWSTGGTSMAFAKHCRKCGLHRAEHSTGSQRNPGEHDTVEYRMLDDDEIAAHIASGSMDEREPSDPVVD